MPRRFMVMPTTVTVVSMTTSDPVASPTDDDLVLRLASSAYLARFTGSSRVHTESDLRLYFAWCADHQLGLLRCAKPGQVRSLIR